MHIWWSLFVILLALGLLLLWLARRGRAQSGLPSGRVIAADTSGWKRLPQPLFSAEHGLTGRPDYVVADGAHLVPVEVKSGRAPEQPYASHVMQLAAYCVLVEETYARAPTYGLIHYEDRTFAVDYTREMRDALLDTLDAMRADLASGGADRSHDEPRRCARCGYREQCGQGLA